MSQQQQQQQQPSLRPSTWVQFISRSQYCLVTLDGAAAALTLSVGMSVRVA